MYKAIIVPLPVRLILEMLRYNTSTSSQCFEVHDSSVILDQCSVMRLLTHRSIKEGY